MDSRASGASQDDGRGGEACFLYVAELGHEAVSDWRALGYSVTEKKDLHFLNYRQMAQLLDDRHFALSRAEGKSVFYFSITNGGFPFAWIPLAFQAPQPNERVPRDFACRSVRHNLSLFKETRDAVKEGLQLVKGGPVTGLRGDLILALERSFFIYKGAKKLAGAKTKKLYADLLAQVKQVRSASDGDFFRDWARVRRLVFAKAKNDIEYCKGKTSMTEALLERCTNCVGETYLLTALFTDARFEPPPGWELGHQMFDDHLRAVLFNEKLKRTYDLATGDTGRFKAAIFHSETVYRALWLGHSAFRNQDEIDLVKSYGPRYVYRNWGCYVPAQDLRPDLRPSDLSGIASCDKFVPNGDGPPEHTDNESKTHRESFDEDQVWQGLLRHPPAKDGLRQNDDHSPDRPDGGALEGSLKGWLLKGLSRLGGAFRSSESSMKQRVDVLSKLAENLVPDEREAVLESIREDGFTAKAVELFSLENFAARLGYSHLTLMDAYRGAHGAFDEKESALFMPVHVEYAERLDFIKKEDSQRTELSIDASTAGGNVNEKVIFGRCANGVFEFLCLQTTNSSFAKSLKALAGPERFARLVEAMRLRLTKTVREIEADGEWIGTTDVERFFTEFRSAKYGDLQSELSQIQSFTSILTRANFMSTEGGFSWRSRNGNALLVDMAKSQLHLSELLPALEIVAGLSAVIRDNPMGIVKYVDRLHTDPSKIFAVERIFGNLNSAFLAARAFLFEGYPDRLVHGRFSEWRDYSGASFEILYRILLLKILTHPDYFVSVEAEKDEVPAQRPYYPVSVHDPRVQDRKIRQGPNLDLDRLESVRVELACRDDDLRPSAGTPKFVLGCRKADPTDLHGSGSINAHDRENRLGTNVNPSLKGRAEDRPGGEFDQAQDGLIRRDSMGTDSQGRQALPRSLNKKEAELPPLMQATRPRLGRVGVADAREDNSFIDPRQEVLLQPETWRWLLLHASTHHFLAEPIVKVLLHHVFRKRLIPVWRELLRINFSIRIFEPSDLERELTVITPHAFRQARSEYPPITSGKSEETSAQDLKAVRALRSLLETNENLYHGYESRPFVTVALREIESRLKRGYLRLKRDGIADGDADGTRAVREMIFVDEKSDAGVISPVLCRKNDRYGSFLFAGEGRGCLNLGQFGGHITSDLHDEVLALRLDVISDNAGHVLWKDAQSEKISGIMKLDTGGFWGRHNTVLYPIGDDSNREISDDELVQAIVSRDLGRGGVVGN